MQEPIMRTVKSSRGMLLSIGWVVTSPMLAAEIRVSMRSAIDLVEPLAEA